ncbi:MAG: hypothetical protein GQ576_07065 [Methanococcoides sp.]|nr:hypothetical protein [Methanococcoides sp.]
MTDRFRNGIDINEWFCIPGFSVAGILLVLAGAIQVARGKGGEYEQNQYEK